MHILAGDFHICPLSSFLPLQHWYRTVQSLTVYGEETPGGILWRTSEGQLRKTIVSLDSAGNADTEVLNHLSGDDYSPPVALKTDFKVVS